MENITLKELEVELLLQKEIKEKIELSFQQILGKINILETLIDKAKDKVKKVS